MLKLENTQGPEPTQVPAYEAWAVFADYDGNAPDSNELSYFSSEELAEAAAKTGNNPNGDWLVVGETAYRQPLTAYCGGWEHCKRYRVVKTAVTNREYVRTSLRDWLEAEADESCPADEVC